MFTVVDAIALGMLAAAFILVGLMARDDQLGFGTEDDWTGWDVDCYVHRGRAYLGLHFQRVLERRGNYHGGVHVTPRDRPRGGWRDAWVVHACPLPFLVVRACRRYRA